MRRLALVLVGLFLSQTFSPAGRAQPFGPPDRGQPGDEMIQNYLQKKTDEIHAKFLAGIQTRQDWEKQRSQLKEQYYYMLGLWPLPQKTPLAATVTGTLQGDGFVVEKLHYQSRPRLYVTGNLYRPAKIEPGQRLPAVLYVCGHSGRGRNGNKTAFQSHGIWFARHGYICLIVDTLQLGEIAAIHHGTYREERWWWVSRGYTSAGVECWNGVRGIDYLISRDDVDAGRVAVTGISGGGAATFWIAAADERVKVAVPVSGMADLPSYVSNRVINGHCDCMFLYNTFQWPWTRIAALVAPRPMQFVNSDQDRIFPMDANDRVINRLERLYSLYGAGDVIDAVVSIGGHAYRKDIRQAAFRFINTHLKNDPRPISDSEVELVTGARSRRIHPIDPEKLRVFPTDADIPRGQWNTTIDQRFVSFAQVVSPARGEFATWKNKLLAELRRVSLRPLPEQIAPARLVQQISAEETQLETEPLIQIRMKRVSDFKVPDKPKRILLAVRNAGDAAAEDADEKPGVPLWLRDSYRDGDVVYFCEPRGVGATRWTHKNPPNYVERSHILLGLTVDLGRIRDVAATAGYLADQHAQQHANQHNGQTPLHIVGQGGGAVLAAYAALVQEKIAAVHLHQPPSSHMQEESAVLLNVLRVCDIPQILGMLAPRPLTIEGGDAKALTKTREIYRSAGAAGKFATNASK